MKVELPKVFSQLVPQYKGLVLGTNIDPKFDFYNYACLLCCLSSICNYFGKTEDPVSLNQKLVAVGGYANGGEYVDGALTRVYPEIVEKAVPTPATLTDEQFADIKNALDRHLPVVFGIDYNPKTIAPDYHFVIAVDYNPNDINDFTIADSLGSALEGRTHSLKDYLGFFKPRAANSIEKYFIFTGPIADPISNEVVPTAEERIASADVPPVPTPATAESKPVETEVVRETSTPVNTYFEAQWGKLTSYLEFKKEASEVTFEDTRKVIAGFKSAKTDYYNKMLDAVKESKAVEVKFKNYEEDIRNLKLKLTTEQKLNKSQLDALKNNMPNYDRLTSDLKGAMQAVEKQLDDKVEEVKNLRIEIVHQAAQAETDASLASNATEPVESVPVLQTDVKSIPSLLARFFKRLIIIKHKTL